MENKTEEFSNKLILRDYLAENRTVLANERTLLAYIRTALTFFIAGITFIKFFGDAIVIAIGIFLLPLGAYAIAKGYTSYARMNRLINKQRGFFIDKEGSGK
jgi:putative membrane protein